jgi:hypothetical protein
LLSDGRLGTGPRLDAPGAGGSPVPLFRIALFISSGDLVLMLLTIFRFFRSWDDAAHFQYSRFAMACSMRGEQSGNASTNDVNRGITMTSKNPTCEAAAESAP